ncbi:Uncharacterized conserved protein, heparinase superfamily [Devosia enhydra]|uniref:Uncharacterized conserved protein, heparinase superfamily n=2 Tax=Devosia enhydra TaxID=665118 RepID=A0A1K2I3A1_9HYPH|nr:Uncharacterized conserved protein, heparinase superfamily [Devosia enhydra]
MANSMRFVARRWLLGTADWAATTPVVRWSWTGPSDADLVGTLGEIRPSDRETVLEMMAGRYLLASKLIDTHGVSPFGMPVGHADWLDDLHSFAWLRHFRDSRTEEERRFATTLAMDWIGRDGRFSRDSWKPSLCARRVLNWIRHYNILVEAARPDQVNAIGRSLSMQIQSLKLRGVLATDPVDALLAAIALAGVAVADERRREELPARLRRVTRLIDQQFCEDGLHRSRSAKIQLMVLMELITIDQALNRHHQAYAHTLSDSIEKMFRAMDAISLGTGEPGYFNGTGQLPHDQIVAVQAQSPTRARTSVALGGFGRLVEGRSIVVADSGLVPEPEFACEAHAGALAFEFSHGRELVVGNCGPAPADLEGDTSIFRQGIAHSAPTINAVSAASIATSGPMTGRLMPVGAAPDLRIDVPEQTLSLVSHGWQDRFGVTVERRLTLMPEGKTLVGQDRFTRGRNGRISGACAIRFHLGQGTEVFEADDMLQLQLASGMVWSFLWKAPTCASRIRCASRPISASTARGRSYSRRWWPMAPK